jgi:hypothetical protein
MIIRRRSLFLALALVLLSMDAALAQTSSTTSSSTFNISWSALDPGDDWTWAMLQSVFPVSGTPPTNTGTAATLIGTLLGQITGLVMALAMFFLCYLAKGVALDIPAAPERGRGSWRCRLPCRVHLGGAFHERLL